MPTYLPTCLPTHPPTYLPTYLSTYLLTYPPTYLAGSQALSHEERDLLAQYFKWALGCLRIYSREQGGTGASSSSTPAETKEIFELFVGALLVGVYV